jgi:hypothetical protein
MTVLDAPAILPHLELADAMRLAVGDQLPVYEGWPATIDAPCVVSRPVTRTYVPPCYAAWELALDVVYPLTASLEEAIELAEQLALAIPAGYRAGDTSYSQRSLAGTDYLFATTAVLITR